MVRFSDKQRREVLKALSDWEPYAPSVELSTFDKDEIREDAVLAVAEALGVEGEAAINRMEALRMTA